MCMFAAVADPALSDAKHTRDDRFFLASEFMKVAIDPESAFTLREIVVDDAQMMVTSGFSGFVVGFPDQKWVGSGHTQGGREQVDEVSVEVDGAPIDLPLGDTVYFDREAIVRKTSKIREDVDLVTEIYVTDDTIREVVEARFNTPEFVDQLYPFMYSWSAETDQWMAKTLDGEVIEGMFDSKGGWKVNASTRWSSVFNPTGAVGALVEINKDELSEFLALDRIWDLERYHKQYFVLLRGRELPAGQTLRLESKITVFSAASSEEWKEKISTLTAETN